MFMSNANLASIVCHGPTHHAPGCAAGRSITAAPGSAHHVDLAGQHGHEHHRHDDGLGPLRRRGAGGSGGGQRPLLHPVLPGCWRAGRPGPVLHRGRGACRPCRADTDRAHRQGGSGDAGPDAGAAGLDRTRLARAARRRSIAAAARPWLYARHGVDAVADVGGDALPHHPHRCREAQGVPESHSGHAAAERGRELGVHAGCGPDSGARAHGCRRVHVDRGGNEPGHPGVGRTQRRPRCQGVGNRTPCRLARPDCRAACRAANRDRDDCGGRHLPGARRSTPPRWALPTWRRTP